IALVCPVLSSVFFFQAEDGIRDFHVTGVQTCALPISELAILTMAAWWRSSFEWWAHQPIAVKAGLDAGITEQIRLGDTPSFQQEIGRASCRERVWISVVAVALQKKEEEAVGDLLGVS